MDNLHGGSISKREQEHNTVFFAGLAHWISAVGFAPVLSIPAFAIIVLTGGPVQSGVTPVLFVSILFGFLFPSIAMYAFVKIKGISYDNRESRLLPLLSVAVVYFIGALIVHEMAAPINTTILMFCYGTNTLMIYLISLKWKISVHSMGVAGPTTALVFALGALGGLFGLIMLPVVWSRVYMRKHTPGQVAAGGLLGYFLTSIQFFFFETLAFHVNVNALTIILLIAVLSLLVLTFSFYNSRQVFRFLTIILIVSSLLLGLLFFILSDARADLLLISNLVLFFAMLMLPSSENPSMKIFQNLKWQRQVS